MASKQARNGLKAITVRLPNILVVRVKVYAARKKIKVQDLVASALTSVLAGDVK